MLACATALAAPPGKAWTSLERIYEAGFDYLEAPLLNRDSLGQIWMATTAVTLYGNQINGYGHRWADSAWVQVWEMINGPVWLNYPVLSPRGTSYLVYNGGEPATREQFILQEIVEDVLQSPEVIASVFEYRSSYGAAVGTRRRWAAISDTYLYQGAWFNRGLRMFYSDTVSIWREVDLGPPFEGETVAIVAIDDTTALVAWNALASSDIRFGFITGSTWSGEAGRIGSGHPIQPRFRVRPSGGHWMAFGTNEPHVALLSYREGVWSAPESLFCAHLDGRPQHYSESPDLSRDEDEYPVVVWSSDDIAANLKVCVCIPDEKGDYGLADELDGADNDGAPSVVRDRFGDVWVAYWNYFDTVSWQHTYTTATPSAPRLLGIGPDVSVAWRLSEPAPGSYWAILRSRGEGPLEEVASVRAGPGTSLGWIDSGANTGERLRYRVRRECLDVRYRLDSPEAEWSGISRRHFSVATENPVRGSVMLTVSGADAGPLDVVVFDVQGRVMTKRSATAGGTSQDSIVLDLASVPSGLYLVRVTDARGTRAPTARLVVLE